MNKNLMTGLIVLVSLLVSVSSFGQCKTPVYPDDPAMRSKAEVNLALYSDAFREKKYKVAKGPLLWLIANAPQLTRQLYIDGADLYEDMAKQEKDAAKKEVLIDSMLLMYDLRIKSCGEEANVLNRKANAAFIANYKNVKKLPELLALFDKVFEMNGANVSDASLGYYMNLSYLNARYAKNLNCDQVLERYDKLVEIINVKKKLSMEKNKTSEVDRYNKTKTEIDDIMIKTVTELECANCQFVKEKMEPKYRLNPDMELGKKMFVFMTADKCFDDPLWLELGDKLFDSGERDFGLIKNLAIKHIGNGDNERAQALLKVANETAKDPSQKADALIILGSMEAKKGNMSGARTLFLQANSADPANLDALSKIGDMYMNSFDECKQLKTKAEDRLIYLAAYDMYARAKDGAGMAKAKAQFPSKEEIFELNWTAGDTKHVACWIQTDVSLRTRD